MILKKKKKKSNFEDCNDNCLEESSFNLDNLITSISVMDTNINIKKKKKKRDVL